ncbi:MAG TPA: hypothetical protein VMU39_15055 [Solirubrobacteraceae bacterium]|nr:hypothetical protein [Solirubrobacteraceae bacterium]
MVVGVADDVVGVCVPLSVVIGGPLVDVLAVLVTVTVFVPLDPHPASRAAITAAEAHTRAFTAPSLVRGAGCPIRSRAQRVLGVPRFRAQRPRATLDDCRQLMGSEVTMTRSRHWGRRAAIASAVTAIAAAGLTSGASSKTTMPSGTYKGKTSNGLPVTFKIQGGKVRNFSLTVHALCISVVAASTHLDPILHHITPQPMPISASGKFSAKYYWKQIQSTQAQVDGKANGKTASGHYKISYSTTDGVTSLGVLIIYACQEQGTWKATRK